MKVSGVQGGCLCGAVRYAYDGEFGGALGAVTVCFCAQCRKAQGLGAAVVPASAGGFSLTAGAEALSEYESSSGKFRAFCRMCGSPLYSRRTARPDALRLRVGSLDAAPDGLAIDAQIFTASAPEWTSFDSAPRYPGSELGRS